MGPGSRSAPTPTTPSSSPWATGGKAQRPAGGGTGDSDRDPIAADARRAPRTFRRGCRFRARAFVGRVTGPAPGGSAIEGRPAMGKIVVTEFITLNGVVESPEKWSFPYWGDDIAAYKRRRVFG